MRGRSSGIFCRRFGHRKISLDLSTIIMKMNPLPASFALFATRFAAMMLLLSRPCLAFPSRLIMWRHQTRVRRIASSSSSLLMESPSFSRRDYPEILRIVEDAARRAGEIMQETTGRIKVSSTKANVKDLVTESDVKCQQVIEETIQAKMLPTDIFLGEESVPTGREASMEALNNALESCGDDGLVFICDPIDGTTNFQAGLPLFGASIGVVARNSITEEPEIVVGCIYNPILDEMVSAIRNQGAFLNGKRILKRDTSTTAHLDQALVNVGFPVTQQSTLQASSRAVAALSTRVRGLRMIASAAQILSWIAQDKMQAYVSWNLNAWDIAAGMLIVEESGGCLVNFDGSPATIASRDMIMTSSSGGQPLAQEILSILRDNACLEY